MQVSKRTFGYELEASASRRSSLALRDLKVSGFTTHDFFHEYHCLCSDCKIAGSRITSPRAAFKAQTDSSAGVEFISSPMRWGDRRRWMGRAAALWLRLNKHNVTVTPACGFHVHVLAEDLSDKQIGNLGELFLRHEAVLFRLASSGWDKHRGQGRGYQYSLPLSAYMKRDPAALDRLLIEGKGWLAQEKYNALNFAPLDRQGTVEFRLWNAPLSFKALRTYVDLSVALVERAKKPLPKRRRVRVGTFTRSKDVAAQYEAIENLLADVMDVPDIASIPGLRKDVLDLAVLGRWATAPRSEPQPEYSRPTWIDELLTMPSGGR